MHTQLSEPEKRAFAYGYLYALKMVRELKAQHGLKWEQAVTEAGKMLMPLLGIEGGKHGANLHDLHTP